VPDTKGELVRRGFEAARAGDFELIADLLAEDVRWHGGDPDAIGSCQNRKQALEFMRQAHRRRGLGELIDVIERGDKVVVILRPGPDSEGPATLAANLTTFRDGKVVEMVHYPDPDAALAALRG
jgi:ketosteroid isomerase-like protein